MMMVRVMMIMMMIDLLMIFECANIFKLFIVKKAVQGEELLAEK